MRSYEIRIAETKEEIQQALELRRQVFVEEQQLFDNDDVDDHDHNAIYLTAWSKKTNLLIGTVRCYPDYNNSDIWWGGRLAVHEKYRIRGIGVYLIRAAVEVVQHQQAKQFLASVQRENITLFKKLGWETRGKIFAHQGHPHQIMEADLNVFHASSPQYIRG